MRRRRRPATGRRDAIASVGPVPPEGGTVGLVHGALLASLRGRAAGLPVEARWPLAENDIPTMRYRWRMGVFHLGGEVDDAQPVYRAAWGMPGMLVLHAFALDDVVRSLAAVDQPISWATHREIVETRSALGRDAIARFVPSVSPSVAAVARRARGIVVFADAGRAYLEAIGCRTPAYVVAPPAVDASADVASAAATATALRDRLAGCRHLIVAPTDRAEAADIEHVLSAAASMAPDVHVALVGMADPGRDTLGLGAGAGLGDRLHVQHDLPLADLLAWLAAADLIVDLRRPHHVDVSLGLLRCLQGGRAVVTTVDSITPGAPSDAAVLLQPSPEAAEVARVVHGLLDDSDRRAALGAAAGAFVEQERRRGPVAFAAALEACVLTARDPVGPAMDRWAGALADLGVDEEYLEAGYFLRYARALTSFAGTPQERPEPPGTSLLDSP